MQRRERHDGNSGDTSKHTHGEKSSVGLSDNDAMNITWVSKIEPGLQDSRMMASSAIVQQLTITSMYICWTTFNRYDTCISEMGCMLVERVWHSADEF